MPVTVSTLDSKPITENKIENNQVNKNLDDSVPVTETVLGVIADYIGSSSASDLIKCLLDIGAQYGHPTKAWDPRMHRYIHKQENKNHIIDIRATARHLISALEILYISARSNEKILFVCTNPQMNEMIEEEATRCGQYFIATRWRGGLLTNSYTTQASINNMIDKQALLDDSGSLMKKKSRLMIQREIEKAHKALGGIKEMGAQPDLVIIASLVTNHVAVKEIKDLQKRGVNIKSIGLADTNSNPQTVDFPIPINDDSSRVLEFVFKLMSNVVIQGLRDGGHAASDMIPEMMESFQAETNLELS